MHHLLSKLQQKIKRFYSLQEHYGFDIVPAADVSELFDEVASPHLSGYTRVRPGLYALQVNSDIFHVIKLQAMKGLSYSCLWGVSLGYLPRIQGARLRYHRTIKSVRFDLFEEPFEYFELDHARWPEGVEFFADSGFGPKRLGETLTQLWSLLHEPVRDWLASTIDLPGVLARCEEQAGREWLGGGHDPDPLLVQAFTLSRLGRKSEASRCLNQHSQRVDLSAESLELLQASLN